VARQPCDETADGQHVVAPDSVRAAVFKIEGVDSVAMSVACAECGLRTGFVVEVPLQSGWTTETLTLQTVVERASVPNSRPPPVLRVIEDGKTDG
jgi:hypothetical protein